MNGRPFAESAIDKFFAHANENAYAVEEGWEDSLLPLSSHQHGLLEVALAVLQRDCLSETAKPARDPRTGEPLFRLRVTSDRSGIDVFYNVFLSRYIVDGVTTMTILVCVRRVYPIGN